MNAGIRNIFLTLISCGALLWTHTAVAVDIQVKITGAVFIPPCEINGKDADFSVSFGKIALQKVDGRNYAVAKTVSVNCQFYQGKPYILLSSGSILPGASDNILQTSGVNSSSLGVALYQGDSVDPNYPLRIGAGVQGKYGYEIKKGLSTPNAQSSQFTFTAVPYKLGNADLKAGTFSASVTMNISYL